MPLYNFRCTRCGREYEALYTHDEMEAVEAKIGEPRCYFPCRGSMIRVPSKANIRGETVSRG